ncbi:hypothetical protein [Streptomyces sp. NPDC000880]
MKWRSARFTWSRSSASVIASAFSCSSSSFYPARAAAQCRAVERALGESVPDAQAVLDERHAATA